jgi:pimeloyl-ACP methyl ester carboxylesterase
LPTPTPSLLAGFDIAFTAPLQPGGVTHYLDVHAPDEAQDLPLIVLVPGFSESRRVYTGISRALADKGAVVFTVDGPAWIPEVAAEENGRGYREMAETIACAIRFARQAGPDFGADSGYVVLVGVSNGAGAGMYNSLIEDRVGELWDAFAAVRGGPPQQVDCVAQGASARVDEFIGTVGAYDNPDIVPEDRELWEVSNIYAQIGRNPDLRVRLVHGELDTMIPIELAIHLEAALAEAEYDVALTRFDGGHTISAAQIIEQILVFEEE